MVGWLVLSAQSTTKGYISVVGGQLRGDRECPFSGGTSSGRVWRKVPESDAGSVQLAVLHSPVVETMPTVNVAACCSVCDPVRPQTGPREVRSGVRGGAVLSGPHGCQRHPSRRQLYRLHVQR